jgi:hypothetical protein
MDGSYAVARYKARMLTPAKARKLRHTPEQRADLLMRAVTMDEIAHAGQLLGLTFREAYRERARLFETRWGV